MEAAPDANGAGQAEAERAAAEGLSSMGFQQPRPKHIGQGLSVFVSNVGCGFLAGAATLVAAPVLGAREEGLTGFAKGLGTGILGAVLGLATGVKGLYDGAVATPATFQASVEGKEWDETTQQWKFYDLSVERAEVLADGAEDALFKERRAARKAKRAAPALAGESSAPAKKVFDTAFYDELGVSPDATEGAIKKAYYKQALKCHPDKCPGDEKAQGRFQRIGAAYQVLSDPEARKRYDVKGLADVDAKAHVDASTFFAMVFGSEQFEGLVGELQLASMMRAATSDGAADDDVPDAEELAFKQRKRVVKLAATLLDDVLRPYFEGPAENAEATILSRADELVSTPFGAALVLVIAGVYEASARRALSTYAEGAALVMRDGAHVAGTKFDVVRDATRAVASTRAAARAEQDRAEASAAAGKAAANPWAHLTSDTEGAGDVSDAPWMIVADRHGKWHAEYYMRSESVLAVWRDMSYSFAAVLFERKLVVEGGFGPWVVNKTYGTPSAVDAIKLAAHVEAGAVVTRESAAAAVARGRQVEMMSAVMEAAWRLSVVDIEATLHKACHKVLADHGVDESVRKDRAVAMRNVALLFRARATAAGHADTWQQALKRQIGAGAGPGAPPPSAKAPPAAKEPAAK